MKVELGKNELGERNRVATERRENRERNRRRRHEEAKREISVRVGNRRNFLGAKTAQRPAQWQETAKSKMSADDRIPLWLDCDPGPLFNPNILVM
jgi:hypothetical protein